MAMRLEELRGQKTERSDGFTFSWNGESIRAYPGESIAGALMASGRRTLRYGIHSKDNRGMLCGIGECYECRVEVNGILHQRACVTPVQPGMVVRTMGTGESPEEN